MCCTLMIIILIVWSRWHLWPMGTHSNWLLNNFDTTLALSDIFLDFWCVHPGSSFTFSTLDMELAISLKSSDFFFSVQFSSVAQSCPTLCDPMDCSTPGLPVHGQLLEFTQTHVRWVSDAIQPSHPLSSPSPPALNLSQHRGLLNELALCFKWPKYWSFSFNISPSNGYPWLSSFRMDWLDLLAVQGTLKRLLQCQLKSISSSALSFLYSPTLTSIPDYRKNHSLD